MRHPKRADGAAAARLVAGSPTVCQLCVTFVPQAELVAGLCPGCRWFVRRVGGGPDAA